MVKFKPWESNQIISFVPPDGQFDLMSYRVKKLKTTPIYVKPQLTSDSGNCRVNVMVGIRNDPGKPIDSITVQFRLPLLIASADLTANYGTVDILADQTCLWTIGQIPKDKAPSLSGNLHLEEGLTHLHTFPTFQVKFRVMGVALSGLQVDKLEVRNTPSTPYKGFRAQTKAGRKRCTSKFIKEHHGVEDLPVACDARRYDEPGVVMARFRAQATPPGHGQRVRPCLRLWQRGRASGRARTRGRWLRPCQGVWLRLRTLSPLRLCRLRFLRPRLRASPLHFSTRIHYFLCPQSSIQCHLLFPHHTAACACPTRKSGRNPPRR
ncbi:hypothetical protein GUJ93_ZPchr0285g7157 [Zizania palustris]|uniref:MHD domain-containing protein n=1 Tax=Zizania palustris TaxID=103762 RepID=A0A8J5T7C1_ZIZPA|nr:hypothetical protein GUJ93_ZPchr0285g7157 [Zizania palustris]